MQLLKLEPETFGSDCTFEHNQGHNSGLGRLKNVACEKHDRTFRILRPGGLCPPPITSR